MKPFYDRFLTKYKELRAEGHRAIDAHRSAKYWVRYGDPRSKKLDVLPSRHEAYKGIQRTDLPNGWYFTVEFEYDSDSGPPWKEYDGMGVIEESRSHPGDSYNDWILYSERGWYRYFDWKATLPEAIKDGWDAKPYRTGSKHEQAMRAMRSTADYLERWCNNQWWYVGLIVTLFDADGNEIEEESCWGYESECVDYLCQEARSWAAHMIKRHRKDLRAQAHAARVESRFRDAMECGL